MQQRAERSDDRADLNQLVIFATVVQHQGFTAAGRVLGLPKSTVSRKVTQLEERLGAQLLRRTTRSLSLTEVGAAFYERCARITTQINEAESAVRRMHHEPCGLLRVAAPPEIGSAFLSEVTSEFLKAHAQVDVELELSGRDVELLDEGFDLLLRAGPPTAAGATVLAKELGHVHDSLVASPAYLERRGLPQTLGELSDHDLVVRREHQRGLGIRLHGPDGASVVLSGRPRLVVNSIAMLHEATRAGLGVALLPMSRCRADLEAGRLRELLSGWTCGLTRIHALYPAAHHLAAKLRVFLEYVSARL